MNSMYIGRISLRGNLTHKSRHHRATTKEMGASCSNEIKSTNQEASIDFAPFLIFLKKGKNSLFQFLVGPFFFKFGNVFDFCDDFALSRVWITVDTSNLLEIIHYFLPLSRHWAS